MLFVIMIVKVYVKYEILRILTARSNLLYSRHAVFNQLKDKDSWSVKSPGLNNDTPIHRSRFRCKQFPSIVVNAAHAIPSTLSPHHTSSASTLFLLSKLLSMPCSPTHAFSRPPGIQF